MRDAVNPNLEAFNAKSTALAYAAQADLHPCEAHCIANFVPPGAAVLDLGVGGGRTTPHLLERAGRYVGVDYAPEMIEAASARYPAAEFICADAQHMPMLDSGSFDVALFSFNGLSCLPGKPEIARCLGEVFRVLKPGGRFICSVANSRFTIATPRLDGANAIQLVWRTALAVLKTGDLMQQQVRNGFYTRPEWRRYVRVDGGVYLFGSTPARMTAMLEDAGFIPSEAFDYDYPKRRHALLVGSYCYVAQKPVSNV